MTIAVRDGAHPLSSNEITPDWLSGVLSAEFPGVRIATAACTGERFGTSRSARPDFTYADEAGPADQSNDRRASSA
jgi:hypothetical protein